MNWITDGIHSGDRVRITPSARVEAHHPDEWFTVLSVYGEHGSTFDAQRTNERAIDGGRRYLYGISVDMITERGTKGPR